MSNLLKYFRKAHGSITLQCCYDHESVPYSSKDNESVNDTKLPMLAGVAAIDGVYIYIYAFSRRFYPKRLTVHLGYTFFCQYMCSLGIEPTTFALLTQCSNHWATGTQVLMVLPVWCHNTLCHLPTAPTGVTDMTMACFKNILDFEKHVDFGHLSEVILDVFFKHSFLIYLVQQCLLIFSFVYLNFV